MAIFTFHRHQMREAKIIRPKTKLTTMIKTFTGVEGLWVKIASTSTWKWGDVWLSVRFQMDSRTLWVPGCFAGALMWAVRFISCHTVVETGRAPGGSTLLWCCDCGRGVLPALQAVRGRGWCGDPLWGSTPLLCSPSSWCRGDPETKKHTNLRR